jgi:Cu/Ag efflux protein CusF
MDRLLVKALIAGVVALAAIGFGPTALAQSALVDGQVTKVDDATKKITIKHGPFKKFDMDEPMTMVYLVQDPAMLRLVKAGDKIKFDAERINGQFTVTKLQKRR